jgi:hypothetical protein
MSATSASGLVGHLSDGAARLSASDELLNGTSSRGERLSCCQHRLEPPYSETAAHLGGLAEPLAGRDSLPITVRISIVILPGAPPSASREASIVSTPSTYAPLAAARPLPRVLDPGVALRLEGVAVLAGAVALFSVTDVSWWLFGLLFLAPDIGLLGYLAGARTGASTYNLTHGLPAPLALAVTGYLAGSAVLLPVALVWIAHIGFDRALGYGLKYTTDFHDTHLQRVA